MNKSFWCDNNGPIVQTEAGKVRGYKLNDLYVFHGIKYAQAKRFEMPTPAQPWEGVKDAFIYGHVSPTITDPECLGRQDLVMDPLFGYRFWPANEDCQYVNVWTKNINNGAKKPVMVWIHGGGFAAGSSIEQASYDGSNLAKDNDVVVVSLNHRLNIIGYLNLSEYGEKYKYSANVGMADIVEALRWVHVNIERFGGDPDNVTIFGQSGGGGKVQTLLQMPAAAPYFNKAIIQSGITYPFADEEKKVVDGKKLADAVVKELGLTKETIDEIQNVTYEQLRDAYKKVSPVLAKQGVNTGWGPTADGYYLGNAVVNGFSEKAKNTPVIVGHCFAEHYLWADDFSNYEMSEAEKYDRVKSMFGEHTDEMIALFKKAYPDDDLLNLYHMDWMFRRGTIEYLDAKAKANKDVNNYSYVIDYNFQFYSGMPSYHATDLALVFNNTDRVVAFNEPAAQKLGVQMSTAWANFAKTGDPNSRITPAWEPYTQGNEATMIFAENCRNAVDYDRELVVKHQDYTPITSIGQLFKVPIH